MGRHSWAGHGQHVLGEPGLWKKDSIILLSGSKKVMGASYSASAQAIV